MRSHRSTDVFQHAVPRSVIGGAVQQAVDHAEVLVDLGDGRLTRVGIAELGGHEHSAVPVARELGGHRLAALVITGHQREPRRSAFTQQPGGGLPEALAASRD